jgi:hypothetical protein
MKKSATLFAIFCLIGLSKSAVSPNYYDDWDEVNYETFETIETYLPPAYGVEHVEVY